MFSHRMKIPAWIHPEAWESLSNREKDFMKMVAHGGYTKDQICRFLYIESDVTFWRMRGRIKKKISLWNEKRPAIWREGEKKI